MKKIICTLLTIISLSVFTISVNAEIYLKGARSCGVWVNERNTKEVGSETWLVGYVSGLAVGTNKNFLKDLDSESIFLWVDNYCHTNPLNDLSDAGLALYYELKKKKAFK